MPVAYKERAMRAVSSQSFIAIWSVQALWTIFEFLFTNLISNFKTLDKLKKKSPHKRTWNLVAEKAVSLWQLYFPIHGMESWNEIFIWGLEIKL